MIRSLFFLIAVTALVVVVSVLGGGEGYVEARFDDLVVEMHTGFLVGAALFAGALFLIVGVLLKTGIDLPGRMRRRAYERRRSKGMLALTRGLEAVAAGDARDATRLAKQSTKQLDEPALTRLLTAQAAQLAGDEETARGAFAAMLAAPETEFLGRRGLYLQAMKQGDPKAAAEHAERAFRLRPNAEWAFRSVFGLALDRAAWGDARAALDLARKNAVVEADEARRTEAALLTADAHAAAAAGDFATAQREAEEAAKLAPDFAPAAVLAAERLAASGKIQRAEKAIEAAWSEKPHRALAAAYAKLRDEEAPAEKADRLARLADLKPFDDESVLLRAEAGVLRGDWAAARENLETLLAKRPTARALSLMGRTVEGATGSAEAARAWYDRAVTAPREAGLGVGGAFDLPAAAWTKVVREYAAHGRIEPPAIEETARGLSPDEIRMLIPAEPSPEAEIEAEPDAAADAASDVAAADPGEPAARSGGDDAADAPPEAGPEAAETGEGAPEPAPLSPDDAPRGGPEPDEPDDAGPPEDAGAATPDGGSGTAAKERS